jgi:hypothetical protein
MRIGRVAGVGLLAAIGWATAAPVPEPAPAAAPSPAAATVTAGPKLVVESTVVDLGQVTRGGTVNGTFLLRNTGTETLKILSAKPG